MQSLFVKTTVCLVIAIAATSNHVEAQNMAPIWHAPVVTGHVASSASFKAKAPILPYVASKQSAWKPDGVHQVDSIAEALLRDPRQKFNDKHEVTWGSRSIKTVRGHYLILLTYKLSPAYFSHPKGASRSKIRYRHTAWLMPEKGETDPSKLYTYQPFLLVETPPYYLLSSIKSPATNTVLMDDFSSPDGTIMGWKYKGKLYSMLLPQWTQK